MPNNEMDYSLIHHSPDGTGMFLVTLPGTPDRGSYMTELEFKEWIVSSIGGAVIPKGDILSTNLPAADAGNKGWEYYCTDLNKYAISDGTAWIYFSNSPIVQTPDATDTGHALSNAVVTTLINGLDAQVDTNTARLNQHESRIENLEQKAGDYTTVQYRGTNAVPTGKAKNGLVESIVGKTRAWNQLCQPIVQDVAYWVSADINKGTIVRNNNGEITYTIVSVDGGYDSGIKANGSLNPPVYQHGHKILFSFDVKSSVAGITIGGDIANVAYVDGSYVWATTSTSYKNCAVIFVADVNSGTFLCRRSINAGQVGDTITYKNINAFDLTLIFGPGNEPSTPADALAQLPALGEYNAYDAGSLVSTEVSGVRSTHNNIWNQEWENGTYSSAGGPVSSAKNIRSKSTEPIPCEPNTDYYFYSGTQATREVFFYTFADTFISYQTLTANGSFTTPATAYKMRFAMYQVYGNTYHNDITIAKGSTAIISFIPYGTLDTLSLSETVTLKGAGSVADELDVESGVITRKVGETLFTASTPWENANGTTYMATIGVVNSNKDALLQGVYRQVSSYSECINNVGTFYIGGSNNDKVYVNDSTFTSVSACQSAMANKTIYYGLATPTTEFIDPIIDNFIQVQGGGTVETIQEQSPVIDNCLDVGYLTV